MNSSSSAMRNTTMLSRMLRARWCVWTNAWRKYCLTYNLGKTPNSNVYIHTQKSSFAMRHQAVGYANKIKVNSAAVGNVKGRCVQVWTVERHAFDVYTMGRCSVGRALAFAENAGYGIVRNVVVDVILCLSKKVNKL